MKPEKIEELIELMKKQGVAELEMKDGDHEIKIKFPNYSSTNGLMQPTMMPMQAQPLQQAAYPTQPVSPMPASQSETSESKSELQPGESYILSPFVGTFYESSSPGADKFVEQGKSVSKGQVLCIVEAMKLMNEIEAEVSGTITKILVKNEEPIEFDQPLFVIKEN